MSIKKQLKECIARNYDSENERYVEDFVVEDDENGFPMSEINAPEEMEKVIGNSGKVWYSGGFDSPGYSINIYSYAFIEKGKLEVGSVEFEIF